MRNLITRINKKNILFFILLSGFSCFSQTESNQFSVLRFTRISGQLNLLGNYRESESEINNITRRQKDTYLSGLFYLRTQGFVIHPNFMLINFNGMYNTHKITNNYIGTPLYSEKIINDGFDVAATFFRKKNFNLNAYAGIYNSVLNIDNLTKINSNTKSVLANFSYSNKILPFTLNYSRQKTTNQTIGSVGSFTLDQQNYQGTATKSFSPRDSHSILFIHGNNTSYQNDNVLPYRISYTSDLWQLLDNFSWGLGRKYLFSSSLVNSRERGNILYKRVNGQQNLLLKLPANLTSSNYLNWGRSEQELYKVTNIGFHTALNHQLFYSLSSGITYDHNQAEQNYYKEKSDKIGINFNYTKKIQGGRLNLNYAYFNEYKSTKTPSINSYIFHEEYTLIDNEITYLKNQNVNMQSVIVKDVTGTIIYQLNIDYLLIDLNPYVEIVRIPGGLIANNSKVYLDYFAVKPGKYNYEMNYRSFATELYLLKDKLDLYYRWSNQRFTDYNLSDNFALDFFTRQVAGFSINFDFIKAGAEYEHIESTILPYSGMKYFIVYQKSMKDLTFTIRGNLLDFQMTNEKARRRDFDAATKIAYSITRNVKINVDYTYRDSRGQGIDMQIHTFRFEANITLLKLYLSVGNEMYWDRYLSSKTNYRGTYIQLTRNF